MSDLHDILARHLLVEESARYWQHKCVKQQAEIERLNKRHDDFLQEFWKTNAENAKLQAVVDAAKRNGYATDELIKALAALEEADDE